jgi:GMP synthase (glutamine-hydrolysing)
LVREKAYLCQAIEANKIILGICLGAQLLAKVLNAPVTRNPHREIGWFDITPDPALAGTPWARVFPRAEVFHWHGDTFAIPDGAIPIASSAACAHQGFIYGDRVVGLQFHLETTQTTAQRLIQACRDELDGTTYVQSAREMLDKPERFARLEPMLAALWDRLEEAINPDV